MTDNITNEDLKQIEAKAEKNKVVGLMYRENWDDDTILAMIARIREAEGQKPPCSPHCYHHQTHPCEKCGRISGYLPIVLRQAENTRLREALARYGRHTPACKHIMEHNKNINCSCGYGKAMKSETPERR